VFTARYELSPYITQIRFVFKGLHRRYVTFNRQHKMEVAMNDGLKGPPYTVQFNCVKKLHEKLNRMCSGTAQVSHQVCQFFVISVCLLVRVTVVDKKKAVVCCLLATSAIMLSEKKK